MQIIRFRSHSAILLRPQLTPMSHAGTSAPKPAGLNPVNGTYRQIVHEYAQPGISMRL